MNRAKNMFDFNDYAAEDVPLGDPPPEPENFDDFEPWEARGRMDLAPDIAQARKFLAALDPAAERFVFQTFDDSRNKKPELARVITGTLDQCATQLIDLNQRGAGVFVTINRSKNGGRKKEDIVAYRAIWREADEPDLPELPIKPNMTIETSPRHKHEYFFIDDAGPDKGDALMRSMVEKYGSDKNAKDRSRVLRLPGFYHRKGSPHMVRIIGHNPMPRYSIDEVSQYIPPMKEDHQAKSQMPGDTTPYGAKALGEELAALYAASEGQRNAQLNRSAFNLGQLIGGGVIDRGHVESALVAAAASIGLAAGEVAATIRSGIEAGLKEPRKPPEQQQESSKNRAQDKALQNCVNLVCAADIRPESVKWLWPGWLAAGKIHIIAGIAGHGKSTLLFSIAATVSKGGRWPDGTWAEAGEVVIWSGEDDPGDTIVPRLIAAGADLSKIHIVEDVIIDGKKRSFDPAEDMPILRKAMASRRVKLLIIDPIVAAVSGDSHKNAEVRRSLQPLVDLAAGLDVAVYGVTHFTKGTAGRDPIERVTSSLAFGALTRLVTVATKLPDDGNHPQGARLFARAKSNIGPDGGGFHYFIEVGPIPGHPEIENTFITWGDQVDGTARELLGRAEALEPDDFKSREAVEWLRDALTDGPQPAKELLSAAKQVGISRTTLQRAKDRLKVRSTKVGFAKGWGWYIPEDSVEEPIHPGAESSAQKHTQHIDSIEDSAKVPHARNLGVSESFTPIDNAAKIPSHGIFANVAQPCGFQALRVTKIPQPTVLGSSRDDGILNSDDEVIL